MGLKQKISLFFVAFFIFTLLILSLVMYYFTSISYSVIEQDEMQANLNRLDNSFNNQLNVVVSKAKDWAVWDDSYNYVLGLNPEFVDSEVVPGYLSLIGVNFLSHRDLNGHVLHTGGLRNFDDSEFDVVLAKQFETEIGIKLPVHETPESWHGVLAMSGQPPLLIASEPILQSSGEGAPSGSVVFGQFFNERSVEELSSDLLYDISWAQVGAQDMPADFADAYSSFAGGEETVMHESTSDIFSGYLLIRDMEDRPIIIMRLDMPRTSYEQGLRTRSILLVSLIIILSLLTVVLYTIIGRIVVNRVTKLSRAVQAIGTGARPSLLNSGSDEIAVLGYEIGRSISKLDESTAVVAAHVAELRKYKQAMEQVSDMIIITDSNFKIIFANQAAETMTGYTRNQLIGWDAPSLWTNDDVLAETLRKSMVGHGVNISQEVTSPKKNGEKYIAELHLSSLNDESGRMLHLVGVSYDITKAKEIDRMKTEFISVASHQLKTPLASIRWITEMLMEEKSGLTGEQREYLGQILLVNERLIRLVNDLLNVSRIETGRKFDIIKESTDIMALVERASVDQEILARQKDIKISVNQGAPSSLTVNTDKEKIYQVLHNLINNAVKYSPERAEVTIDVDDGIEDVTISIHDQGIGIPEDDRKKIFSKFFRAQNVGETEGTGLGLFIVKAIVEAHGGRIWFESVESKGTVFRFTLPKA